MRRGNDLKHETAKTTSASLQRSVHLYVSHSTEIPLVVCWFTAAAQRVAKDACTRQPNSSTCNMIANMWVRLLYMTLYLHLTVHCLHYGAGGARKRNSSCPANRTLGAMLDYKCVTNEHYSCFSMILPCTYMFLCHPTYPPNSLFITFQAWPVLAILLCAASGGALARCPHASPGTHSLSAASLPSSHPPVGPARKLAQVYCNLTCNELVGMHAWPIHVQVYRLGRHVARCKMCDGKRTLDNKRSVLVLFPCTHALWYSRAWVMALMLARTG